MTGRLSRAVALCMVLAIWSSCNRGRTDALMDEEDTLVIADTLANDSAAFFEDEDEGLSLEKHQTEVFGDFIFAFTHNTRFQAERVRFPLPVTDLDGTERTIRSGKQFRSEFRLPGNEYYTLLLGDRGQMEVLQNDTTSTEVALQCINLESQTMICYNFQRTTGRWFLINRIHQPIDPRLSDFFRFYGEFTTDSIFQQECLAEQLVFSMQDPDEEEMDIEGTIDRGQWPVFRPEMPSGEFVNIDFGQELADAHRLLLLQCGISNGMLDVFTFQREGEHWKLTAYEN